MGEEGGRRGWEKKMGEEDGKRRWKRRMGKEDGRGGWERRAVTVLGRFLSQLRAKMGISGVFGWSCVTFLAKRNPERIGVIYGPLDHRPESTSTTIS
jgi:hypothetical protein